MKHTLTREIRTWRERLIDETREGARIATDIPAEELLDDTDEDLWESWEDEDDRNEDTWDAWEEEDERDYI